ncbi:MAG: hypothetical protein DRI46_09310 [Chloroflexi bacterium]|nr:MAG: hypothetical protein DRI46_09310 [Chloroflexota bacterium]
MIVFPDGNFCRVFKIPSNYPTGFCFGEGRPTNFQMMDWFNPIEPDMVGVDINWEEYKERLKEWLLEKSYVKAGCNYLVITDFNEVFMFRKAYSEDSEKFLSRHVNVGGGD